MHESSVRVPLPCPGVTIWALACRVAAGHCDLRLAVCLLLNGAARRFQHHYLPGHKLHQMGCLRCLVLPHMQQMGVLESARPDDVSSVVCPSQAVVLEQPG
jgi:hypothetical protein